MTTPPTDAQWAVMSKAIQSISNRPDAEPFRIPVAWKALGLYDYPQVIKKPTDLGTIKKNIQDRNYKSIPKAAEDVRLVWSNCMTYNADGSDFFNLAKNLSKKWEERYSKVVSDLQLDADPAATASGEVSSKISLDDKRTFAKSLYKITKEELGKILVEIDTKCPAALTKNSGEDECELNVDKISPALFQELKQFVSTCSSKSQSVKKKGSSSKGRK